MSSGWRVELTGAVVDELRGLDALTRRRIADRIDVLEERGLPPALRREAVDGTLTVVPVGDHRLHCLEDEAGRTVYVVELTSMEPQRLGTRGGGGMDGFTAEVGFALRSLRRSPGFATAAILTLALGIGSTAAIFSVAHGVVFAPLPYEEPDEVATIWASWDNFPDKTWLSVGEFRRFHQESRAFEDMALYGGRTSSFTSADDPEQVRAATTTPNLFDVLGVTPQLGRVFTWDEARDGARLVLLTHDVWQRRFGGDPEVVGRTAQLDGEGWRVVGVLPEDFRLPVDFASSRPYQLVYPRYVDLESPAPPLEGGGSHGSFGVGRLRDGVTVEEAQADLERVMAGVEPVGLYSPERRFAPRVFSAEEEVVGSVRTAIWVLFGAVGLVLLIACGNVANLLLARSERRGRDVAVRAAMGAGRFRILRQLLLEHLVLAGIAGVLGVLVARVAVTALLAVDPEAIPRSANVQVDPTVLLFSVAITLLTVLLFGWVPALRVSRSGVAGVLQEGRRGSGSGPGATRGQDVLVAVQLAMAVVLVVGAGLMARTLVELMAVDPGFEAGNVLTVRLTVPPGRYESADDIAGVYQALLDEVRNVPGVRTAGAARLLPLASTMGDAFFRPVGYQPGPNESTQGDWQWATPGYLESLGIPLLEGRSFDEADRRDGRSVVMINEAVARRYWGEESPIGRAVLAAGAQDTAIVVGVVGNVSHNGLVDPPKTRYYVPHAQVHEDWSGSMRGMTLTVATEGPPERYVAPVRDAVGAVDPALPVARIQTLDEVMAASVAQPRFATLLLGSFAGIALVLAVVGIYGVLAYRVSHRTREIGVRMALGAESRQVVGLVVRQGMTMAVIGVVVGTGAAWLLSGLLSDLLYRVRPQDPLTFVAVPLLFTGVALVACWMPAVRASRVQPASVLRYE